MMEVDSATLRRLIDGMITGDDESWRMMLQILGPTINAVCRRAGLDRDEFEDIAQVFVLRLLENNSRRLRAIKVRQVESFYGWVKVVVSRIVLDRVNDTSRRKEFETKAGDDRWHEETVSSRIADNIENRVLIGKALDTLKPVDRALFWLDFSGLKGGEIAMITGVNVHTIQKRLSRMRSKMQDMLK
jgi:RNA polymerase sigma factor (sigma-70 family)